MRPTAPQQGKDQAQRLHRLHRLRRVVTWVVVVALGLALTSVVSAAGAGLHDEFSLDRQSPFDSQPVDRGHVSNRADE